MQLSKIETLELTFQFEAIFETFPDILFKISRDGEILSCKSGKPSLRYLDPEKHVGSQLSDILPPNYVKMFKHAVANLNNLGDMACLEFPFDKDGKIFWFEARIVPFYKKQLLAILRDITDRKEMAAKLELEKIRAAEGDEIMKVVNEAFGSIEQPDNEHANDVETLRAKIAEYHRLNDKLNYEINLRRGMESTLKMHLQELQKRNKELEHFRYLASNDFQEPLRHITSFAKILSTKYKTQLDNEAFEMLDFMVDGGEQMQKIVLNLSDYTQISTNSHLKETIKIEDKILIAKKRLAAKIDQKKAIISFGALPVINAFREQIITLFENLIDNALKFSKENIQPEIFIGVKENSSHYEFFVKDNGIGFNMDFHDRIFMLFQRLHPRSNFSGAGIGLAFCKKIIEQHGGEIWAKSEPGQGSTFYFTIPKVNLN